MKLGRWTSGAMDPRCSVCVLMGKTDRAAERHRQQSMVLVPLPSPGVTGLYPAGLHCSQV